MSTTPKTKSTKNRDLEAELYVWHYIRTIYESKHNKNVPLALKNLILQFFMDKSIINCKLLNFYERDAFYSLLRRRFGFDFKLNLLYRASENAYSALRFHKLCDGKGPTVTLIKSHTKNIFGGYTSISWSDGTSSGGTALSPNRYIADKSAFLFRIISGSGNEFKPELYGFDKSVPWSHSYAVCHDEGYGPSFGCYPGIKIIDKCNGEIPKARGQPNKYSTRSGPCSRELPHCYNTNNEYLSGSVYSDQMQPESHLFSVKEYEVFKVIGEEIKKM